MSDTAAAPAAARGRGRGAARGGARGGGRKKGPHALGDPTYTGEQKSLAALLGPRHSVTVWCRVIWTSHPRIHVGVETCFD